MKGELLDIIEEEKLLVSFCKRKKKIEGFSEVANFICNFFLLKYF